MKRVVITGLGCVTPLGTGISHFWPHLIAGKSGITSLTSKTHSSTGTVLQYDDIPSQVAGCVEHGELPGQFSTKNLDYPVGVALLSE